MKQTKNGAVTVGDNVRKSTFMTNVTWYRYGTEAVEQKDRRERGDQKESLTLGLGYGLVFICETSGLLVWPLVRVSGR